MDGHKVKLILLLTTPLEQTAEHLQLLQRLSSLLPQVRDGLLDARDVHAVLKVIAERERRTGRTTYLNLRQDQVAFELQTDLKDGLTDQEAKQRLRIHGPNRLEKGRRVPGYLRLGRNFFSFFALLLWLAAALCFLPTVDMPQLGIAIRMVIVVNGFFSYWQERKSDRAVEALQRLMAQKSRAVREGRVVEIDATELVPGDVVLLEEGDLVPADARLIEAFEVEVDNSALTGESTSSRRYKSDQPVLIPGKFLWIELPNVVFAGTSILRGSGQAVVQAFIFFIGLFVANVPEGLLPTVTLALAWRWESPEWPKETIHSAAARRFSQTDPIRGAIAGPSETGGIDERFQ